MKFLARSLDLQKTKTSYRNAAWFYDFWASLTESYAEEKVLELASIKDGQRIAEIACGTGIVFEKVVARNPNGRNIGIDLSPAMLKSSKKRLQKLDTRNYELKEGNALALDLEENSMDLLINNFMVDLLPEETFDTVASEFHRVLNPGGTVIIANFSFGQSRLNRIWYWIARNMPDLLTGCRPVSFKEHLVKAGFIIEAHVQISQNTFPSEVIKATKK